MLEKIIFCLNFSQGILVFFLQCLVPFESCAYFVVFFVNLQSIFHDEFFPFRGGFEVEDFYLASEFLKLPSRTYQAVPQFLDHFRTVVNYLF